MNIPPDIALSRAKADCVLQYDRAFVLGSEPVLIMARIAAQCYSMPIKNWPDKSQLAVAVALSRITPAEFEERFCGAVLMLDAEMEKEFPGDAEARSALILQKAK